MGAKTCRVIQAQGDARELLAASPQLQAAETAAFVAALFPGVDVASPRAADLSCTYVYDNSVLAGCFAGLRILVSPEVALDRPSELPPRFIAPTGTTLLHAMHSVVDWLAFAVWRDGVLVRSLSVAPDNGIIEDIGERLAFEQPYWNGHHPADDPDEDIEDRYPLPFHPLELGEAALGAFFGFQLEGHLDASQLSPERTPLLHFSEASRAEPQAVPAKRPWWQFW